MSVKHTLFVSIMAADILLNRLIRTSICQTEFPVFIRLCHNRIHNLLQIFHRRIVKWYYNTDFRIVSKFIFSLFLDLILVRSVIFDPQVVIGILLGYCASDMINKVSKIMFPDVFHIFTEFTRTQCVIQPACLRTLPLHFLYINPVASLSDLVLKAHPNPGSMNRISWNSDRKSNLVILFDIIRIFDSRILTDCPIYFTGYFFLLFIHHRNPVYTQHIYKPALHHKLRLQKLFHIDFVDDRRIQHRFSDFSVFQPRNDLLRFFTEHLNLQIFEFLDPLWHIQYLQLKSHRPKHADILSGGHYIRTFLPADSGR